MPDAAGAARPAVRILFIGNSYTTRNDLPGLITVLAAQAQSARRVETVVVSAAGASLRRHWNGGQALAALHDQQWTYVVLQEQSTLPVKNPARFRENVALFADPIRAHGATPVLYLTWARRDAPEAQDLITAATLAAASDIAAPVVPVGVAWQAARLQHPEIALHLADGSHPTPAGSYLTACVFLASLPAIAPATLPVAPPLGLAPDTAARLRQVAATTVAAWPAAG